VSDDGREQGPDDVEDPAGRHLVGTVIADRYRVRRLIGTGGMGSVYHGEHVHMRNAVAIKVLHSELLTVDEIVARFEREAIASARINDPHVVNATDFGRLEDGSFYLVLEYVQGRILSELIDAGPVGQVRALKIAHQIVQALVAAHAAGVIHRDLKPDNVMLVARPDEPDFVKVLDFGIAKVEIGDRPSMGPNVPVLTQLGTVFGTPQYMAPEQAAGAAVDHRADLYTVGIMLYEMLTGTPPFAAEDVSDVLLQQINEPPPPLPAHCNASLVKLVETQLEKEPDGRSQTAQELLAWIEEVLREFSVVVALPGGVPSSADLEVPAREPPPPEPPAPDPDSPAPKSTLRAAVTPVGTALAVVAGVGLGVFWLLAERSESPDRTASPSATASASSAPAEIDSALGLLLASAATGDQQAIVAIEKLPPARRTAGTWVALARGRMGLERYRAALSAYKRALELDPALAKDQTLLGDVRLAASVESTAEQALGIAARQLGSDGADLLYHVWVFTKAKTATTQLAKQLVYSKDVRPKASPALAVALDLREAEGCEQIKALLPRVVLHGDTRVLRILQPLTVQRGCGDREREDCYPCLRGDTALTDGIAAAGKRPGPQFLTR
jgi:serine/threonine protein kinase